MADIYIQLQIDYCARACVRDINIYFNIRWSIKIVNTLFR